MNQDRLERFIAGPRTPVPGSGFTLEQLQDYRWKNLNAIDRGLCRAAAKAILQDFDLVPKNRPEPAPVMKVSAMQQRVLLEIASYDPFEHVVRFANVAVHLQMSERDVRLATRALARKGLVKRVAAFREDDGYLAGSGYVATDAGLNLAREIGGAA